MTDGGFDLYPRSQPPELRKRIAEVIWHAGSNAALSIADRLIESGVIADPADSKHDDGPIESYRKGKIDALREAADYIAETCEGNFNVDACETCRAVQQLRDRANTIETGNGS